MQNTDILSDDDIRRRFISEYPLFAIYRDTFERSLRLIVKSIVNFKYRNNFSTSDTIPSILEYSA